MTTLLSLMACLMSPAPLINLAESRVKQGFKQGLLPTTNLEARSKDEINQVLEKATQGSSKGPYQHGQAHEIIEIICPERVKTLRHGQRLFDDLGRLIKGEPQT